MPDTIKLFQKEIQKLFGKDTSEDEAKELLNIITVYVKQNTYSHEIDYSNNY